MSVRSKCIRTEKNNQRLRRSRAKQDIAYACRTYPQTVVKEFKGLAHAELVMMFPERFYEEVTRFLETVP